jgi:hypothetical protein
MSTNYEGLHCTTSSSLLLNPVLKRIFGPKRDEVTGEWRKLHSEELHILYSFPNIIRQITLHMQLRWHTLLYLLGEWSRHQWISCAFSVDQYRESEWQHFYCAQCSWHIKWRLMKRMFCVSHTSRLMPSQHLCYNAKGFMLIKLSWKTTLCLSY